MPVIDGMEVEDILKKEEAGLVYVLRLQGGKYYVDFTQNLPARLRAHFGGRGARVTRECRPEKVVLIKEGTRETESQVVRAIAQKYSWFNVRGAGYSHTF